MPPNQTTVEGSPLVFSAANGRLIRIDDPDIGASPLVVNLSASNLSGGVLPHITLSNTSGLASISGNGSNLLQFEGTLPAINAALSQLTFFSIDNGNFAVNIAVNDPVNAESGSAAFQVSVTNANPQIQLAGDDDPNEGNQVQVPVQLFDAGPLDQPHHSWSVAYQHSTIASGVDRPVEFFAFADGSYDLTITATDKDGGLTVLNQVVFVRNLSPTVVMTGVMRDGEIFLTLNLGDPGNDQLDVEIFWSQVDDDPDRLNVAPGTITVSHRYTPEELNFDADELTIFVHVSDGEDFARASLDFGQGVAAETAPPRIEPLPRTPAPDRVAPPRVLAGSTFPDVSEADSGGASGTGNPDSADIHQFVIRVVSADGEESGNYPLPDEAIQDLPAFLTALGVPDGHYRVYLISGDVERLVLDGHLRAGRIVDPADDSQPSFDRPAENNKHVATIHPLGGQPAAMKQSMPATAPAGVASNAVADPSVGAIVTPAIAGSLDAEAAIVCVEGVNADEPSSTSATLANTVVIGAALAGTFALAATLASNPPTTQTPPVSRRFARIGQLARKLSRFAASR